MGCLNSSGQFSHWFGNIHLSGPCNRSCYFCIGQHMMALDHLNTLKSWPLPGIQQFVQRCRERSITEINLTASNSDPLLYEHHEELTSFLRQHIHGAVLGLRTNGVLAAKCPHTWALYDKASVSITSFNPLIYRKTMGQGEPPDIRAILALRPDMPIKVNIVLCPEIIESNDLLATLDALALAGIKKVNLREPYGQPHVGSPFRGKSGNRLGMPRYDHKGIDVTYWDVHFVEVESVNLYANGVVSDTYPITKGHSPSGQVQGQEHFHASGRIRQQWANFSSPIP